MIKAVIIDDEQKLRIALADIIKLYCQEVEIAGEAEGVKDGIKVIEKLGPDLVFLDIELIDGTGFDILKHFANKVKRTDEIKFKTVFTTAYDQFAIKAFKFSAMDYLMKPIDPDDLVLAVEKVKSLMNSQTTPNYDVLMESLGEVVDETRKIALSTLERIHVSKISDIIRCESKDNYTMFYIIDQKPILVSKTLKDYDELLSDYGFERVHQSHLINLRHMKSYEKMYGGSIIMTDGGQIPVSQRKKERVLKYLKSLQ